MSGRKQHYIPQFLQRGFEASRTGAKSQVIVVRHDKEAYLTSTEGSAAQRDFYSNPLSDGTGSLDDQITAFERSHLAVAVEELREAPIGRVESEKVAQTVAHLSWRTASVRGSMRTMTESAFDQMTDILGDPDETRGFLGIDANSEESSLNDSVRADLVKLGVGAWPEKFQRAIERVIVFRIRERFDDLSHRSKGPLLNKLRDVRGRISNSVSDGHVRMLSETLVPPTHFEELRKLRWSIHAPSESSGHFILPDCVAIARSATAITYEPLILASVGEADIVVMPISKRRLLVGSRGQFGSCAALPTINVDLAKCSFEFFVSSQLDSDTKALKNLIGSRIAALSADPLEQQKAPIAPPKKLVCELAKVHVKTPIGRTGDSIKTAISKLAQEAVSPECASYLESIVVANDMAQALQTLSGHALTANQIEKAATHGSVEPVRRGGEWRIRVLVPRTIGQALAQQNASAEHQAAAAILRLLFGRAHYFTCWASQCQQVVAGVDPEMDAWSASTLHLTLRAGGSYVSGLSLGRSGVKATFETEQWAPRATPYLSCAAELINAREHALKDGNVDRLIADAMPPIEILLDVVATVCGIEKSSGAQLLHTSELGLALQRAGLSEWVSLLARDLDQHWSSRSFWESRSDLKTLTAHIERLLWTIGVVVSPTETGHWIDVLDTNLAAVFANTLRQ